MKYLKHRSLAVAAQPGVLLPAFLRIYHFHVAHPGAAAHLLRGCTLIKLRAMRPKISAFPKCYLDRIAGERSMTVFEWIQRARWLDADGLEMYEGFFTSLDDAY